MQTRRGRVENEVVALADPHGVPEGAEVTVLIPTPDELVETSQEDELAIIDAGLAAARRPARIDAREFLRALARRT
jgi:hypothetical protein